MEEDLPSEKVQKEVSSEKKAEGGSRKKSIGMKRAKDKQEQESSKRQRVEDDKEEEELKKCFELAKEEEIAINVIPLATKVPVVGFQIHTRGKPGYYEIFRADGSSKLYHVFSQLLSDFDREDLVNLWKLVKAKHGDNRPEEDFERVLWGDLRVMFEPDVESEVWRSLQGYKVTVWKLYDSCGVHFVRFKHLHVFMLVEKRYPLTPITITNMLNKKLQADQWNEMVYQLLKLMIQKMNIKFRGGLLGLKGFLKLLLLSTAGTKVNTDCLPTTTIFEELARMGHPLLLNHLHLNHRRNSLRGSKKKNTEVPYPSDSIADVPNKEHVPTHSNDPLLSGEDRMKLTELMNMCTKLSKRVLDLEHTKTALAQEITNLKLSVKKLEKKPRFTTHNFKRLYKVGVTRRVESLDNESLGAQEDASKQGRSRIEAIDKDAKIVVKTEEPVINAAITTKSIPVSTDEIDLAQESTLAQALAAMKSGKPKEKDVVKESSENVSTATTMVSTATTTIVATPAITTPPQQRAKGIAFREPVESTITTTVPSQKSKDKGKAIMIEPKNPLKKKDQIELDEELVREIEAEEQAESERIQKEIAAQEEASRAAIYEEWDNEQAMIEADYELAANL
ncbi:hypothetical protein Tco_1087489 [Tanacetum coccineum]